MQNEILKVEGMSCGHCVAAIEKALKQVGVNKVNVDLQNKSVQVEFDNSKITTDAIKEAIEDQGYDVL